MADDIAVAEASPKELQNALYASCASQPADKIFDQHDLLALGVIPRDDLGLLLSCTRQLTKEGLLKVMTKDGVACWRVVKKEDAAKYKTLSGDEALVYSYIESSAREGIWLKILRVRTNLHMTILNRCLKTLEAKNFIKPTKSVKFPNRKTYMLAHLQPSEAATGGPFYTDGVLDEEFVHQLGMWTEKYIIGRSWWHPPLNDGVKKKDKARTSKEQAIRLRAAELDRGHASRDRSKDMLPMPPGYQGYPTVQEITKAMNASGISGVVMKEAEMLQLLDVLGWDGKIEKVPNSKGYRALRQVGRWGGSNHAGGLREAPCGRCPIFEICDDGGPVNAKTCEYFEDWLNIL
ncbi:MAG: hypothetical protein Q9191_006278 [Dirinaria sp. TL-2023a]